MGPFTELYLLKTAGKYFPELVDGKVRIKPSPEVTSILVGLAHESIDKHKKRLADTRKRKLKGSLYTAGLGGLLGGSLGSLASKKAKTPYMAALGGALLGLPLGYAAIDRKRMATNKKDLMRAKNYLEEVRKGEESVYSPADYADLDRLEWEDSGHPNEDFFRGSWLYDSEQEAKKLSPSKRRTYEREKRRFLKGVDLKYKDLLRKKGIL